MTWAMLKRRVLWFAIFVVAFPLPFLVALVLTPPALVREWGYRWCRYFAARVVWAWGIDAEGVETGGTVKRRLARVKRRRRL